MQDWKVGRSFDRAKRDWVALYEDSSGGTFRNPIQDLSAGGIFLRTSRPLSPGTDIDVVLVSLRESKFIRLPGQVVWRGRKERHRGMGVKFDHSTGTLNAMRDALT